MQTGRSSYVYDPARVAAVRESGLLEDAADEVFGCFTRLTAELVRAPMALISLVDAERVSFLSSAGLPEPWTSPRAIPIADSLGHYAVAAGEPLIVGNTRRNRLTHGNRIVREIGIGAYLGTPVRSADEHVLGTLAAMDHEPREWTSRDVENIGELAVLVRREIQRGNALRRSAKRVRAATEKADEVLSNSPQFRSLVEQSLVGICIIQADGFRYANPRTAEIFGYAQQALIDMRLLDLVVEADRVRVARNLKRLCNDQESMRYTFQGRRGDGRVIDVEAHGTRTVFDGGAAVIATLLDITERNRAEQRLRRSEEHFRSLIENAWDVIHVVDAEDVIQYISPSVKRVLGYDPTEMIGRRSAEFVHPDDVFRTRAAFEKAIEGSVGDGFLDVRLRRRDGSWCTAEIRGKLIEDPDGGRAGVINPHDVTARKQAERALRESEERYRLVARATRSAVRDWNVGSGVCFWNGFSDVLRYTPEEIGTTVDWWYERIHPEDRERVVNGIQAAIDSVGDSWSDEYRFLRGDGAYATVQDCCHIARNERGMPVRVIGSLVDVTERKRAEEAQRFLVRASTLLGEELDLEATLASLSRLTLPTLADYCLIDLVEAEQDRESLRRVAYAHVDPTKETILRKNENHPLDTDPERHPVIRAVRSREPVLVTDCTDVLLDEISHSGEHRRRLEELGLCSFMIVPLVVHGRTLGVITLAAAESGRRYGPRELLVAEQLAHRAALAIENARLYREAQEAIRARQEVLGVVTHDLRNPLNTIHLSAELRLDSADERRGENVQSLERIRRASQQMAGMIEDLLDASSMEAGRFSVERARHDVARLVREACGLLQPLCEEKRIQMTQVLEEGLAEIDIDSRQIQRVFSNLVGNAIKFTPEGGRITVRAWRDAGEVCFSVADTGPGIPAEQLPHVFDRYWQAREGDRRGVGLGLAIARGIVAAHGGRLWVRSGDGEGATFCFAIPQTSSSGGGVSRRRVASPTASPATG